MTLRRRQGLKPGKPLARGKPLQAGAGLKRGDGLKAGAKSKENWRRTGSTLPAKSRRPGAQARDAADKEWSVWILSLYGRRCILCGAPASEPHHCYPKGTPDGADVRHEPWAGVPLCTDCHKRAHAWGWLKTALQVVAQEQRRLLLFEREPITVLEIRRIVDEHRPPKRAAGGG